VTPVVARVFYRYSDIIISIILRFLLVTKLKEMEVTNSGNTIGRIVQEWSICKPKFRIENAAGDCVLRVVGPFCTFSLCGDVQFQLFTSDESKQVGKITKQWSGLAREIFTDADHFGINFPQETDVNIKAVLIGACFLIVSH